MASVILWIILGVLAILVIWIIAAFNTLVSLRNRIENSWSQIDVQLKRRYDLIPNLVRTVKGYARHERETFDSITKARTAAMAAKTLPERAKQENIISGALKTLFAVAENYPRLLASNNFKMLQEELSSTESKIAYSRQFYNDSVLSYDNARRTFPGNIIASMFNFTEQKEYFRAEETEKKAVKVEF